MDLSEFFQEYPSVAVAFSGGTDSAYLLYEAKRCAKSVRAYYVKSAFQPKFELEDALRMVDELDVQMTVIDVDVLADDDIISNTQRRCYYCKRRIFSTIKERALGEGFKVLLDGTNASDDVSDRPGMAALEELSVLSPLRMCGLTKADIRRLSEEAGLFTWNKPPYACLATRIFPGQQIEARLLERTETAEGFLASLGFHDFRVRTVGELARIQVRAKDIALVMQHRKQILERLGKEYSGVCLDLETRDGE